MLTKVHNYILQETNAKEKKWVERHMSSFLEDTPREAMGIYFTKEEVQSVSVSSRYSNSS